MELKDRSIKFEQALDQALTRLGRVAKLFAEASPASSDLRFAEGVLQDIRGALAEQRARLEAEAARGLRRKQLLAATHLGTKVLREEWNA